MGSDMQNVLFTLLIVGGAITAFVLFVVFIAVPLFRGVGKGIGLGFRAIGWFFRHIFEFIGGVFSDIVRFIGALIAMVVLIPLVPLNIVIGRWSAAGHFAEGVKRECHVGSSCVYRVLVRRPLKLLLLDGVLEGLEQRVPEAMHAAPGSDKPNRRTGQFDGYTIIGSLRAGGSGAKLYIAQPDELKRQRTRHMPERVVIKSFALTEGSSLPQIVRESRALECAKQLGHVLDHGMDEHRFYYVMPYHPGDHLGIITRQMHGECGGRGLDHRRLNFVMSSMSDLLATLSAYHRGGLWHKDVKPENVIVHDGRAHLVDLGLVTPLRSAMTLTTHGTEYFRDPEMVRQALRGVKVHQVNGAKFDIYAAGAVLYFMIENTFPAHGGLSRFVAKSPEALRWIVRRAMTEYNQRYATADEMLADVRFVMSAPDPYEVKPAELPSMLGESVPPIVEEKDEFEILAAAASPASIPSPAASGGAPEAGFVAAPRRPKLTVTNWWTGEYVAEDLLEAQRQGERDFHEQAAMLRQQVGVIGRKARAGAISARAAGREQIKAARQRAKELRTRAAARRHRVAPAPKGSGWAILIGIASFFFLASILASSFMFRSDSQRSAAHVASARSGRTIVLAVDSPVPVTDALRSQIKRIAADYRKRGYEVIDNPGPSIEAVLPALRQWKKNPDRESDRIIEDFLEAQHAYGLVHVPIEKGKRRGSVNAQAATFVSSTRPGAEQRRKEFADAIPAPPSQPYLVINDHPAKSDLAVSAEIERRLKAYREKGWSLVNNDEVEVKVRHVLPVGPLDSDGRLSPVLHSTLAQANLGGLLRIDGTQGTQPVGQRVSITRIDRDASLPLTFGPPSSAGGTSAFMTPLAPTSPVAPWTGEVEIEEDAAELVGSPN